MCGRKMKGKGVHREDRASRAPKSNAPEVGRDIASEQDLKNSVKHPPRQSSRVKDYR